MATRRNPSDEAARRARRQINEVLSELRDARRSASLSQEVVAAAIGCSRQLVAALESGQIAHVDPIALARFGAAVGLDVSYRTFPGGTPLRDAGQLRLLGRLRVRISQGWQCRTEVPVSADPADRRAIDMVLGRERRRVGVEGITRLMDAQAQVRAALLKQEVSGVDRMVLVLSDSHHNRRAVRDASPTLDPAFPLRSRQVLRALGVGIPPAANGIVLL
jgi:transcriptional regulator with XRE-family HTH domain